MFRGDWETVKRRNGKEIRHMSRREETKKRGKTKRRDQKLSFK